MEENINTILGIENSKIENQNIDQTEVSNRQFDNNRYPALKTISGVYIALAWIIGIIVFIGSLYFLSTESMKMMALGLILLGGLLVLGLAAISEIIKLFIDIEKNTRKFTKN